MNFINPFILFGLVLASIPIILHFLNLRKLKKIEFSSLKFLIELQKSHIRKLKIKQWLLLLLRTLTIIFIVLAFARPLTRGHLPGFSKYAESSVIVFVDNSPSMNLTDEYGNRFNFAKRIAKNLIEQFNSRDEIVLIPLGNLQSADFYNFTSNFAKISEDLSKMRISQSSINISNAIATSAELFKKAHFLNKEIYFITDNQLLNFENFDDTFITNIRPAIYFVEVGANSKANLTNISVDSIIPTTRIFQFNNPVITKIKLTNHSVEDKSKLSMSMLFNAIKVAQKNVNIKSETSTYNDISAVLKSNDVLLGEVELENDALPNDNRRFFGVILPNKPQVALISDNNNLFLQNALGINYQLNYCNVEIIPTINFNSTDLTKFDVLVFENYSKINASRVENYLKNGGRAIFFASEDLSTNQEIVKFLKLDKSEIINYSNNSNNIVSKIAKSHPIFEGVFTNSNIEVAEKISIYKEIPYKKGIPIIESITGNLLSEEYLLKGKYLFFSINPMQEWGNIPTSALFPIIIYRSILYLSSLPELSTSVMIGSSVQLKIPARFAEGSNFSIIDPNGNKQVVYAPNLSTGIIVSIPKVELLGNYVVYNSKEKPVGIISANINPKESVISKIGNEKVEELLKKKFEKEVTVAFLQDYVNLSQQIKRVRSGSELWQIFLVLAIITAISELLVQRLMKNE
jgi:hypothetical protein